MSSACASSASFGDPRAEPAPGSVKPDEFIRDKRSCAIVLDEDLQFVPRVDRERFCARFYQRRSNVFVLAEEDRFREQL